MIDQTESLQTELAALVGADHVRTATPDDASDGVQPRFVVEPGDGDAVAAVLRAATAAGLCVAPRGGGTKTGWGNPPPKLDLLLSTRRLNAVLEHAWGDMTATVQAGCTVAEFGRVLAEHGQRLALDPLWPDRATIGGILATNDSGALRQRFGSLRDLILGVTVALPDGTLARSGGKVVKNVAGYDLPKLMTGALGTLGVIVDATFRLYPLPIHTQTLCIAAPGIAIANKLTLAILDSTMVPTGVQLYVHPDSAPQLAVRFEGVEAAIASQVDRLSAIAKELGCHDIAPADDAVWAARETLWHGGPMALVGKVSVLPDRIAELGDSLDRVLRPLRAEWKLLMQALGVGALRIDGANEQVLLTALTLLRSELARSGGSLVVLHAPPAAKARIDVWGDMGDALPLMRRVKGQFDGKNILNPDRLIQF
jgi:glycolate oxidase FAD binding subunit